MTRVSCLMPTYNRREFLSLSVGSFLEQEWEDKELVVIDDGEDSAYQTLMDTWGDAALQYEHVGEKKCLGWKYRRATELATGDVFSYWSDDDWCHPKRLTAQVPVALRDGACLVQDVPYLDACTGEAMILHTDSGLDGTLVFTRDYYERYGPFNPEWQFAALFYQKRPEGTPHPTTFGSPATVQPELFPRIPPPDFPLYIGTMHWKSWWDHRAPKTPIPFESLPAPVRDWYHTHSCPACHGDRLSPPCEACDGSGGFSVSI